MTEHKPWLSLPDEDPPERGLAELMAAARMKAEVMAHPPWWKRLFAVMRRPPVLALATVVVVVCGVIVVGHDHDKAMSAAPTVDVPSGSIETRERGVTTEAPPPAEQQAPTEKNHETLRTETPKAPGVNQVEQEKALDDVKVGGDVKVGPDTKVGGEKQDARFESQTVEKAATIDKAAPLDTAPMADNGETKAAVVTKGGKKAPVDPLARCRAAAVRRDCATAKACVDGAPASYKANAANDAALKSCL